MKVSIWNLKLILLGKWPHGKYELQYLYLQVGIISSSTSLVHKDHSNWTVVIGWTAWALRIVDAEASESPMYFIFPSSTNFFISPICNRYTNKTWLVQYIKLEIKRVQPRKKYINENMKVTINVKLSVVKKNKHPYLIMVHISNFVVGVRRASRI